jgi:hypothetical protein
LPAVGLLAVLFVTALVLLRVWQKQPQERLRSSGLLLFLLALLGLILGTGWGRQTGFVARYAVLAVPLLFSVYFAWEVYARPVAARLLQMVLFTVLCLPLVQTTLVVSALAREAHTQADAFERDLAAGLPPPVLAERHPQLYVPTSILYGKDGFAHGLDLLRKAGIAPFRSAQEDPDRYVLTSRVPPEQARAYAAAFVAYGAKVGPPQGRGEPRPDRACVLRKAMVIAAAVPDSGLSEDVVVGAGREAATVGQLWLSNSALLLAGGPPPRDRLQGVPFPHLGDALWRYQVAVRTNSQGAPELVVSGRNDDLLVTAPLQPADAGQDLPLALEGKKGKDGGSLLVLTVLGKYQAELPIGAPGG